MDVETLALEAHGRSPVSPGDLPIRIKMLAHNLIGHGTPEAVILAGEARVREVDKSKVEYSAWLTIEQATALRA